MQDILGCIFCICVQALLDLQMNSDLKAQLHDLTFTGAKVACEVDAFQYVVLVVRN